MWPLRTALLGTALLGAATAGSYTCDNEYGAHCPEEVPGEGLIACLRKAGEAGKDLSADCTAWLGMMGGCRDDIDKHCQGNDADAFVCLTQWTKRDALEEGCAKTLPEPEEPKPRKKSKAAAKRKAHERNTKDAAARKLRDEQEEAKKKKKKKSKKKKKKKKKKKVVEEDDGEL